MTTLPARLWGLFLVLVLAGATAAGEIRWYASWSRTPTEILADNPGTGKISLKDDKSVLEHEGAAYLVATNIETYSTATSDKPDVFTHKPFQLDLTITDKDSNQSHLFTFTGEFNGTLTALSNLTGPVFTGETSLSYLIGKNLYMVTMNSIVPPERPGADYEGAIGGKAEVGVQAMPQVPEPTTLILSALGVSLGAFRWYRHRCRQRHICSPDPGGAPPGP